MGLSRYFRNCTQCGHQAWTTCIGHGTDSYENPPKCPQCGGSWKFGDPATTDLKPVGNLAICGRCQMRQTDAYVSNAPQSMHDSWCNECIWAVNKGAQQILHGISINKEGFVIGTPAGKPPLTAREELVQTARNLTLLLGAFLIFIGLGGLFLEKGNRVLGRYSVVLGIPVLIAGLLWFYLDYRKEQRQQSPNQHGARTT